MDEIIEELFADAFPEWEYVDDCEIICPCGFAIEHDGHCPEGCVSPLLSMGLI